jgi:hypothetical protein
MRGPREPSATMSRSVIVATLRRWSEEAERKMNRYEKGSPPYEKFLGEHYALKDAALAIAQGMEDEPFYTE